MARSLAIEASVNYLNQIVQAQNLVRDTLLSRLPDRCRLCHRAIEGEGGVIDDRDESGETHIYHSGCMETIDEMREKHKADL